MATTLTLIFGAMFMFITTLVITGVAAKRLIKKRHALTAKVPRALLPDSRDELGGWAYMPDGVGQVIKKTLEGGWGIEVAWVEREGAREQVTITATREGGNMPEGMGYKVGAHAPRLVEPSAGRMAWRVIVPSAIDLVFDDFPVPVPHEAFVDALFQKDLPHADNRRALGMISPTGLFVDSRGFVLEGMFEGEVYTPTSLAALDEIVQAYTAWFTWRASGLESRDVLRDALTHTRDREAYIHGGLFYADMLGGDEREAYLTDCVLGYPQELQLSRRAFRALIESGRKQKLREALMGQRLELHRWLIDMGEVEALLWLIEDEQQKAAWLSFVLQDPPSPPRNHNDIAGHKRITAWAERLAMIPRELLTSPLVADATRQHIFQFALEHWQGTYTLSLIHI